MKWIAKFRKWLALHNDVDALSEYYREKNDPGYLEDEMTDDEFRRFVYEQDEAACPSDTSRTIAVKNGEALYRIWASSEIGDNSAFDDARKLGLIYPFDPDYADPVAARIEFHGDADDESMAAVLQRFDEAAGIPRGLMDGAADRESESISLMARAQLHTMDYEMKEKLKAIHEEERVQHIGVWQMYETVERMVEDCDPYDPKIQAVEWAIVTNDPHLGYNGVYSRDEQESFWHRPVEIISNQSVQPPEEIINTGPLIDGVRTKRSGWVYRADDVSSTREKPIQDESFPGMNAWLEATCDSTLDGNHRPAQGTWCMACGQEPAPQESTERPSRGTEQVPVEQVLREEGNARVPRNRHPKHSRGKTLLPGQIGIALTPENESGVLDRGVGVHPPTIVE